MLDGAEEKCEMMLSVGTKPQRAVVLWCCGAVVLWPRLELLLWRCVGVQEEEETLERWTSASAEITDPSHDVMVVQGVTVCSVAMCHTNQFSVHGFTAVSGDGRSVCVLPRRRETHN